MCCFYVIVGGDINDANLLNMTPGNLSPLIFFPVIYKNFSPCSPVVKSVMIIILPLIFLLVYLYE